MIALAEKPASPRKGVARHHRCFLEMLPSIRRQAHLAFRGCNPELREELVSEVVANAYVAFARLVELDKQDLAYATPLAQYAIRQVRVGRRVGSRLNVRDATSLYAQQRQGFGVERLDRYDREEGQWIEIVVEDRHCGPDHVAMVRLDFAAWLRTLSHRRRKIAAILATGESTTDVARKFQVSPGRVSQLRRELQQAWEAFVADRPAVETVCSA